MNFLEAVNEIKNGKKVRRAVDGINYHLELEDGFIRRSTESILATDWEVVKEKKTLSDKHFAETDEPKGSNIYYSECNIKDALKEFMDWLKETSMQNPRYLDNKAEEIFGDRLI